MIAAAVALLAAAPASGAAEPVTLHAGRIVPLATIAIVTSKTAAEGDLVPLTVTKDIAIDGHIVVPRGTAAMGQVAGVRTKGAFGQSGRFAVQPLYLTLGGRTIRLEGGGGAHGTVTAGSVIGLIALTPGFTGRSAILPAGSPIAAVVLRDVVLVP